MVNLRLGFALGYAPGCRTLPLKLPCALCQGWTQQAGAVMCLCSLPPPSRSEGSALAAGKGRVGSGSTVRESCRWSTAFSPHHPAGSDVPGCLSMGPHAADVRAAHHARPAHSSAGTAQMLGFNFLQMRGIWLPGRETLQGAAQSSLSLESRSLVPPLFEDQASGPLAPPSASPELAMMPRELKSS